MLCYDNNIQPQYRLLVLSGMQRASRFCSNPEESDPLGVCGPDANLRLVLAG